MAAILKPPHPPGEMFSAFVTARAALPQNMAETMIAQLSTFRDFTCFLGEFMCSNSSTHAFPCVKSFFTSIHGIL